MIEFDVDMGYLLEAGELDCVILNDENGEYEPMEFTSELGSGTCKLIDTTSPVNDDYWNSAKCSECGAEFTCAIFGRSSDTPDADYCPSCGRKVVDQ